MVIPSWTKYLAFLALIVAAVVGYKAWETHQYNRGYAARDVIAKADIDKANAASLLALKKSADAAKANEATLLARLSAADNQRYREEQNHAKTVAKLQSDIDAGNLRLRIAIAGSANQSNQRPSPTNPGITAGLSDETTADVMPATAATVLRIAGDVAASVRRYNALVDRYNEARATCNTVIP